MSIFKRHKIWHTDFSVHGQRFRASLDTTDWREAQSRQKEMIAQANAGKLTAKSRSLCKVGFTQAAEHHLEERKATLATRTIQTEQERLKPLKKYFQQTSLARITCEMLRHYITERKKAGVANKTVNLEMGIVRGLLKRAKRWHLFEGEIKPLPVTHQVGRALTNPEKGWLERMASRNPSWQNARAAMVIAFNTTMRSCELKGLRWVDVEFDQRTITVRHSKTDAGRRVIPLNAPAWEMVLQLRERAARIGANLPQHYVFPACENGRIDPCKPQKSWRSAWRNLTKSIECPGCGLVQKPAKQCRRKRCRADIHRLKSPTANLRFHDLRHHAITALAESQASDQTIMAIAGHVSRDMLEHYSHIRLDAKSRALDYLAPSVEKGEGNERYVTKDDTNARNTAGANELTA
jgi:integrase